MAGRKIIFFMVQNGKAFALKGNCIVSIKSIKYPLHPEKERETFLAIILKLQKENHIQKRIIIFFERKSILYIISHKAAYQTPNF